MTWIPIGLASVILAGGAGGLAVTGCSGDDNTAPPGTDGGLPDTTIGNPDTFVAGQDAAVDSYVAETGPKPVHPKLIVVNASQDFGPLRICVATSTSAAPTTFTILPSLPLPDTVYPRPGGGGGFLPPGLYQGTGGALADYLDLATVNIQPYVIKSTASAVVNDTADAASPVGCDQLLAPDAGGLVLGTDYFQLPVIPAGTFAHGTTNILALVGCLPQSQDTTTYPDDGGPYTPDKARCGTDYDPNTGNIKTLSYVLDTTTPADGGAFGAQVIDLSTAWDGVLSEGALGDPVVQSTAFVNIGPGDGGPTITPLASLVAAQNYPQQLPDAAAPFPATLLASSNLQLTSGTAIAVATLDVAQDAGGSPAVVNQAAFPLGLVVDLTTGSPTNDGIDGGPLFNGGENFTFVLLGDPAAAQLTDPGYSGYGLHVIVFQNHIVPPPAQ